MELKLYKITKDEIISTEYISQNDNAIVVDAEKKSIFLYRSPYSSSFDQFSSKLVYERIINRFLNPNIFLITSLKESSKPEINQIKIFISDHFQNKGRTKIKNILQNLFLFQTIRNRIEKYKNYENSFSFNSKISNSSKIWKLSLWNAILSGFLIIVLIFSLFGVLIPNILNQSDDTILINWIENFTIIFGIILLIIIIIFVINVIFTLFPMKFPIKPELYQYMVENSSKTIEKKE